jgi:cytochrome c-type biogenesis protein CcmH/NrfG
MHFCSLPLLSQAKQLKDYENAVIAKRLEELDEDELQALVEEVERDDF